MGRGGSSSSIVHLRCISCQACVSAALTESQQVILQQRGVLEPSEIHKLATKTREAMGAQETKADCHSDVVDSDAAQQLQHKKFAAPNT